MYNLGAFFIYHYHPCEFSFLSSCAIDSFSWGGWGRTRRNWPANPSAAQQHTHITGNQSAKRKTPQTGPELIPATINPVRWGLCLAFQNLSSLLMPFTSMPANLTWMAYQTISHDKRLPHPFSKTKQNTSKENIITFQSSRSQHPPDLSALTTHRRSWSSFNATSYS